eukprot:6184260-Pleurochrysis_carterae.AAC.2
MEISLAARQKASCSLNTCRPSPCTFGVKFLLQMLLTGSSESGFQLALPSAASWCRSHAVAMYDARTKMAPIKLFISALVGLRLALLRSTLTP